MEQQSGPAGNDAGRKMQDLYQQALNSGKQALNSGKEASSTIGSKGMSLVSQLPEVATFDSSAKADAVRQADQAIRVSVMSQKIAKIFLLISWGLIAIKLLFNVIVLFGSAPTEYIDIKFSMFIQYVAGAGGQAIGVFFAYVMFLLFLHLVANGAHTLRLQVDDGSESS